MTLSTSGWTGSSAPYKYTILSEYCKTKSIINISMSSNATLEEVKEFGKSLIIGGEQTDGSFELIALKIKPSIDIPIEISIGGVINGN